MKHFIKSWECLIEDQNILHPKREVCSRRRYLESFAIEKVCLKTSPEHQFVSNLFLVKKENGNNRPVINLKSLNQFIPHHYFNMESLQSIRDIDLKSAYFCIPL